MANVTADMFRQCGSEIEGDLLYVLEKIYTVEQIRQQVPAGRYRLDFVTHDNVGWELDGKRFHDRERDEMRDKWILANTEIQRIVRVEAAAMVYFMPSTMQVCHKFAIQPTKRPPLDSDIYQLDDICHLIDSAEEAFVEGGYRDGIEGLARSMETFRVCGNVGEVGRLLAFAEEDCWIFDQLESREASLAKWTGKITFRDGH